MAPPTLERAAAERVQAGVREVWALVWARSGCVRGGTCAVRLWVPCLAEVLLAAPPPLPLRKSLPQGAPSR